MCFGTCNLKTSRHSQSLKQVKPEGALGLLKELKEEGYALTCCSYPKSDLVLEVQAEDEVSSRGVSHLQRSCESGPFR